MKLLVVLSIKEHQEQVAKLLQDAGLMRFSVIDMVGYKKKEKDMGWYVVGSKNAKTDSILLFSFTTASCARKAVEEIGTCNEQTDNPFPVHAFILDVEQCSKFL